MSVLIYLIPIALFLGLLGLAAFLWALRNGQFDDLDGAAERALFDDEETEGQSAPLSLKSSDESAFPSDKADKNSRSLRVMD